MIHESAVIFSLLVTIEQFKGVSVAKNQAKTPGGMCSCIQYGKNSAFV